MHAQLHLLDIESPTLKLSEMNNSSTPWPPFYKIKLPDGGFAATFYFTYKTIAIFSQRNKTTLDSINTSDVICKS